MRFEVGAGTNKTFNIQIFIGEILIEASERTKNRSGKNAFWHKSSRLSGNSIEFQQWLEGNQSARLTSVQLLRIFGWEVARVLSILNIYHGLIYIQRKNPFLDSHTIASRSFLRTKWIYYDNSYSKRTPCFPHFPCLSGKAVKVTKAWNFNCDDAHVRVKRISNSDFYRSWCRFFLRN